MVVPVVLYVVNFNLEIFYEYTSMYRPTVWNPPFPISKER